MLRYSYLRMSSESEREIFIDTFGDIAKTTSESFKIRSGGRNQNVKISKFIYTELLLFTAYEIYNRPFTVDEALLLFSTVHKMFINTTKEEEKLIIHAHTFLNSFAEEWEKRTLIQHFYFKQNDEIVKDSMLFIKDNNEYIYLNNNIKYYTSRINSYKKVLTEDFYIELDEGKKEDIISSLLKQRINEKRTYDIFERVENAIYSIDDKFVKNMDKYLDEPYYFRNYKQIYLEEVKAFSDGVVHIAGPTGAGKSVLFDIYIKKLTEEGLKVLYITDTHAPSSINTKIKYDNLGIDSTIIMGRNRQKHIDKFIQSKEKVSMFKIIKDNNKLFDNLDFTCTNIDMHVCQRCDKDINKISDGECNFYKMYKNIKNSDLVITTPYNLFTTLTMQKVDKSTRSPFEILNIWADVIIIDEVDKIQEISEEIFCDLMQVYSMDTVESARGQHLEEFMKLLHNFFTRNNFVNIPKIKEYKENVTNYDIQIDMLHLLFFHQERSTSNIRSWLGSRDFTIIQLIEEWAEKYISSVKIKDGDLLDQKKIINRIYATLNFNINKIRKEIINKIIEQYKNDDIEIYDIFDGVLKDFRKILTNITLTQDQEEELKIKGINFDKNDIKLNLKKIKDTNKRNEELTFIILLASINSYLDSVYKNYKAIFELGIQSNFKQDNKNKDKQSYLPVAPKAENHVFATKPLIKDIDGYRLDIGYEGVTLKKKIYSGIGREILFNNPYAVSTLYDLPTPFTYITSATGAGIESSLYNIKHSVNYLLKRKDYTNSKVNFKCYIYKDRSGEPIRVSGYKDKLMRDKNIIELTKKIRDSIIYPLEESENGILIVTTSYKNGELILEQLLQGGINAKCLYSEELGPFDSKKYINKLDIEKEAKNVKVFIAVDTIIGRGYNIVNSEGKSYFRDIIIINRKMPNPTDLKSKISYIHKYLKIPSIHEDYKSLKRDMYKMNRKISDLNTYSSAPKEVKEAIAGNTAVLLKQIAGRGQRGGTSVNIHLVDSAFYPVTAERNENKIVDTSKTSIFKAWQDIFNNDNPVVNYLYKDIRDGLNNYDLIIEK